MIININFHMTCRYPSINTQLIVDNNGFIRNCEANWAGATHDSRVLANSVVPNYDFEGYHLLGDSGYPCKHYLLTPITAPRDVHERKYTKCAPM